METAHHDRLKHDIDPPAMDVALATSAAPTYFTAAPFPTHSNAGYVDGGIWANSPVMMGLTEAVAVLGVPVENIDMLSIGATTTPFNIAKHADSSIAQWNAGLVEPMFEGQIEAALAQAKLLLGGRLHRINVTVKADQFALDDARPQKIQQLINLGRGEAVKKEKFEPVKGGF